MHNPYTPPNSNLEVKRVSGLRPAGINVLATLFVFFSVASIVLAYLDDNGDREWLIVLACSVFLIVLLRGVFLGREKDRKTGVFLGLFIAVLNALGWYEPSDAHTELQRLLYAAEAVYALVGSVYLHRMKGSAFFSEAQVSP